MDDLSSSQGDIDNPDISPSSPSVDDRQAKVDDAFFCLIMAYVGVVEMQALPPESEQPEFDYPQVMPGFDKPSTRTMFD